MQDIEIYYSKTKVLGLMTIMVGCGTLFAGALYFVNWTRSSELFLKGMLVLCGLGLVFSIPKFFVYTPILTINQSSIYDRKTMKSPIPWAAIADLHIMLVGENRIPSVSVVLKDNVPARYYLKRKRKTKDPQTGRKRATSREINNKVLDISADQLIGIMASLIKTNNAQPRFKQGKTQPLFG